MVMHRLGRRNSGSGSRSFVPQLNHDVLYSIHKCFQCMYLLALSKDSLYLSRLKLGTTWVKVISLQYFGRLECPILFQLFFKDGIS